MISFLNNKLHKDVVIRKCFVKIKYKDLSNVCFCMKTKEKEQDFLLFICNYVIIVLVQTTWHLTRLYVTPEPGLH